MVIFSLPSADGGRLTPVFSTMQRAVGFLQQAQDLGRKVAFDYVFRTAGPSFLPLFPEYTPVLDPVAEAFFQASSDDGAR